MKPVVVLSHCLADEACRYDGQALRDAVVARLAPFVTFRPVCPEVAIGLGVPRDPVRLVETRAGVTLVFGFLSPLLAARERRHFLDLLTRYRASRVPVGAVTTLLRSWAERFDVAYLAEQVMFEPYPEALVSLLDSGKGREP